MRNCGTIKPVMIVAGTRPEAVETGFAKVVGTEKHGILAAMETALTRRKDLPDKSPFSDGKAVEKIVEILRGDLFSV